MILIVKLKKTPKLVTKIVQKTPDYPYKILIIGGLGWGKTNSLQNLINHQPRIDKIYQYAKYLDESKHQYLIDKREKADMKHLKILRLLLLNFQRILKMFMKTLIISIQKKILKY